ncbi:MAG: cobalt ABC transporter ATP-binding protein [Chloroflexi bacterium RBG_13_56_8]|nr:MAG: cobalt ABC transporter ATP-binding protein [Chloroflexi bacterium RBG_13_56_8]
MVSDSNVVELKSLSFSYPDGRQALRGITFSVSEGEKVGLVGPNGAGKSTVLLHLNGILRGQGEVHIDGARVNGGDLGPIRRKVGLVFQDPDDQLFSPTVFDDVAFGPLYMGLEESEVRARVAWALEQVQMSDHAMRMPHHLSLGEKKRVAIATVLSMSPTILALDEPSAGLDPLARENLLALLKRMPQTMIIASHDLDFVAQLCQRAIVLDEGRVLADVPAENILLNPSLLKRGHLYAAK